VAQGVREMKFEWIVAGVAAGALAVGVATLVVALLVLGNVLRSMRMSEERLQILREQQERLEYLHKEHRLLWAQLGVESPPREPSSASETPLERPEGEEVWVDATSPQEVTQRPWWRRMFGG
jgi:hypothetical protein